jgi:hypothetical protein
MEGKLYSAWRAFPAWDAAFVRQRGGLRLKKIVFIDLSSAGETFPLQSAYTIEATVFRMIAVGCSIGAQSTSDLKLSRYSMPGHFSPPPMVKVILRIIS